jgi:toxin FitB
MVLSEAAKPASVANRGAVAWLASQPPLDLAISLLTLGEIRKGTELLPEGKRKDRLRSWLQADLPAQFEGRVLPITSEVAHAWGRLDALAHRSGRPLHVIDGLLLATAEVYALTLVTRNVGDFEGRGVSVENPYSGR